ncbi:MAG TPA: DUF2232 domain-containing protein [Vicinamibacteria bacterium]|nr:DUF2232 domain-containing protein [Vicinamibacteria bacterium]
MAERGPVSTGTGIGAEARLGGLVGAGALSAVLFGSAGLVPALAPLSLASPLPLAVQRLRGGAAGAWLAAALGAALVAASSALPAAGFYVAVLAVPGLLLGESLARGRGLLRGCGWAFAALVAEISAGLALAPRTMAERILAPIEHLRSEAFLAELRTGGLPPEQIAEFTEQVGMLRDALAVVYPAAWVIFAAVLVAANAALLRIYLLRRDPGWLEDGEFERVRWPLPLVVVFVLAGAGVALPLARPAAYNVLLVTAFFFALQGLAVVAFYGRRLAGPPLLRAAVVVLVLANPWAPQILALLGLFDNWFDFRRWAEPPPEPGGGTRSGRSA